MPSTATVDDRFMNLDDDITYIYTAQGWKEIVDGESASGTKIYRHSVNAAISGGSYLGTGTLSFNFNSTNNTPITEINDLEYHGIKATEKIPVCGFFEYSNKKIIAAFISKYHSENPNLHAVGAFVVDSGSIVTFNAAVHKQYITVTDTVTEI